MKKLRIKTDILIAIFIILIINLGLIISIDNSIVSIIYTLILGLLLYIIGKRFNLYG